ncbi:photosystem I assembly protein Ycf3 [Iris pallida]|nr:photosystem I assembly protein Ycf3 [Iris pallida]KAJ6806281.1 photosystem I assembly protein Ycf3 [Iris pallida]KAJ6831815.1 photosystem I assembly protein Ycf3 [Iris pallida]
MSAQSEGNYAEALQNYYEATRPEIDPYDRSYILYNIGLIHTSNGEHTKALEYYFRALERNPFLPQAFNNMAVICHYPYENRPFYRGILKLRRLGSIKLPSIGNKL